MREDFGEPDFDRSNGRIRKRGYVMVIFADAYAKVLFSVRIKPTKNGQGDYPATEEFANRENSW